MSATINAYPLQWPVGWKRTPADRREGARFHGTTKRYNSYQTSEGTRQSVHTLKRDLTIAEGRKRVLEELARMGLSRDDVVISTNLPLRMDGEVRADARNPNDPGVAVYWQDGKHHRVMAIDRYDRVADNLAAVAATVDAMRAIERHGGAMILERAYTGFTALPAPASTKPWRDVLGLADVHHIDGLRLKDAYRSAASAAHPDRSTGSHERMAAVNLAYEQAKTELGYDN
jgi:hypothetical protein